MAARCDGFDEHDSCVMAIAASVVVPIIEPSPRRERASSMREHDENRVSVAVLHDLLDEMGETAALVEPDGTVVTINRVGCERFGITLDAVVGRCIYDFMPPDVAHTRRAVVDDVLATGRPRWFSDRRGDRWYETRIVPVGGHDGRPQQIAVYARDVTRRRSLELARQRNQHDVEQVLAHLPLAVLTIGDDLRVQWGNQRAAAMAGVGATALAGRSPGEVLRCLNRLDDPDGCGHGDRCATCPLRQGATEALATGEPRRGVEVTLTAEDGEEAACRHLVADFVPTTLAGHSGLLVYLQDVTHLRNTEQDLELKGLALDQIADRVTMTDVDGNVLYVNDAVCRMLGRCRKEIVGASVREFGEDQAHGATQEEIIAGTGEHGSWRGEVVNVTPEGREVVLDCRTQRIHDDRGDVVAYCGVSTDITERKRQEERLRESERRFRHLHEQLPIGYFCLDADGYYLDTNPAWQEMVQSTREGLHRRHFSGHVAVDHEVQFRKALDALVDGQSLQVELQVRRRDGTGVTVFCVGRAVLDETGGGHVSHWVAVDVSERRNLEEQLRQSQKMDALGRLAAGVAHDFNNQITVIRGYCDMLLEAADDGSEAHHALDQIQRASERANATTNHLLAFSR
ncbi:PAS domain-containing protein, partial [bacterium]|nr:PAS domain-containing protein [bacterium]